MRAPGLQMERGTRHMASNLKLQTSNSSVIEGLGGAEVGEEVADLLVGEVGEEAFGHEAGR